MADVFSVVFIILGFWVALPALCLTLRAFWPGALERSRAQTAEHPWRCVFVGLGVLLPGVFVSVFVASQPAAAKPIGLLLFAGLFLYTFVGVSGLVTHLGGGLRSPSDEARPWLATLRGALCLVMSATIPFVGWFLICPAALVIGAGAMTLSLFNRAEPDPRAAASAGSDAAFMSAAPQAEKLEMVQARA